MKSEKLLKICNLIITKCPVLKLHSRGFTMIELLVVMSVIIFISSAGVASFSGFNDTQKLQNATFDVSSLLQTAKSEAQSQVKPSSTICSGSLESYKVKFPINNPHAYNLAVKCSGSTSSYDFPLKIVPDSINIWSSDPVYTFNVLTGYVSETGTVTITAGGKTKSINIGGQG